jgi:hypothetical protein
MIDRELPYQDIRAVLSMCAALCAFLLCHTLRHFTVALAHPSTWYVAAHHRCGWVLIATFTWFLCEITNCFCLSGTSLRQPDRAN